MATTTNHAYEKPAEGALNWDVPINGNFDALDVDVMIRDTDANLSSYTPTDGAAFWATDTGVLYTGNGTVWGERGRLVDVSGLSTGEHIVWDGSTLTGEAPPAGGSGGSGNNSYNERVEVEQSGTVEIPIPVPNGETLTVLSWGAIEDDRTATPSGLTMELWNENDSSVASESTDYTASPTGASITNSSGSVSWYKIVCNNGTANDYTIGNTPKSVFVSAEWTVA